MTTLERCVRKPFRKEQEGTYGLVEAHEVSIWSQGCGQDLVHPGIRGVYRHILRVLIWLLLSCGGGQCLRGRPVTPRQQAS
jgi:hypothetical protein